MLIEFLARYYKIFWLIFGALCFCKVILASLFHGNLEGVNGVLFALFKWYNEDEQEMEDVPSRRTTMRIHNIVTLLIYAAILFLIVATFLPMFIGHS